MGKEAEQQAPRETYDYTNYREGIYSPEQAALLLQDKYLDQQYYFGTEKALSFLHKTNVETV